MGERIFEVERESGGEITLRFRPPKGPMFPEAMRKHFWAARREELLTFRSFIDAALEQVEQVEETKEKERKKVDIE